MLIKEQVEEFHKAMGQPILDKPTVPSEERVELRLKLIMEECMELMEACGLNVDEEKELLMNKIKQRNFNVDIVEVIDAVGDIDYVCQGLRCEFGCDAEPIAIEIHRSNMAKVGGGKRFDGKILKPASWTPPNISNELKKQGWTG